MGGLLAADALIEFVQTRTEMRAHLWHNIVECIELDNKVRLFRI